MAGREGGSFVERSIQRAHARRKAAAPQPKPIGEGSGTAAPIPDSAKPKPVGSILTGELSPLLGTGQVGGFLRRLFRPASQLRGGS